MAKILHGTAFLVFAFFFGRNSLYMGIQPLHNIMVKSLRKKEWEKSSANAMYLLTLVLKQLRLKDHGRDSACKELQILPVPRKKLLT